MDKEQELNIRIDTLKNLLTELAIRQYKYATDAYGTIAARISTLEHELDQHGLQAEIVIADGKPHKRKDGSTFAASVTN